MYRAMLRPAAYAASAAVTASTVAVFAVPSEPGNIRPLATSHTPPGAVPSSSSSSSNSNLLWPSLQATGRSWQLVRTAVLMAADYKLDQWGLVVVVVAPPGDDDDDDNSKADERTYWETQVEERRVAFREAQSLYALGGSPPALSLSQRVEAKQDEKKRMQAAAAAFAEAEDHLTRLGSSRQGAVHKKAAHRLLDLCRRNQGVYIKVGQHLANLDYLIPTEYIEVLSSLYDDSPQTAIDDVRTVVRQDLGADPEELFASFDPQPMASASLAQVHVAYEKGTGRKLAVKVQHRGLRETSVGDLHNLVTVVRLAERFFPNFSYGWLADEIAPHLPKEMDFANEGRNAERAARNLQQSGLPCVVPAVHWEYTSPRVLTMDFEEGFKATDLAQLDAAGLRRKDVAHLISSVFAFQVFHLDDGWVHCDPHPANVLLRARPDGTPEMVLVDHGLYRALDRDFQVNYAALWKSLMLADLEGIRQACGAMGIQKAYTLFAAMLTARPFDELIERSKQGSLHYEVQAGNSADKAMIKGYAQQFLHEIFGLLNRLPRQMLLLLKMNDCLRHIDYILGSPTNTVVVTGQYAAEAVYRENLRNSRSWWDRWHNWWTLMQIHFRVHLHDWTVWALDHSQMWRPRLVV